MCDREDWDSWNFGMNFALLVLPAPLIFYFLCETAVVKKFPVFFFFFLAVNFGTVPIHFSRFSSLEDHNRA